ncbi:hypothetical protein DPMN_161630 [Dreissena polymorpha]|uniref:Uncharacterized protein n=1 Tax=Dreissena polymorpha TaxID=45954 RepID=A0A9D4ENT7_DREPO|nr:hypothetical protein DPMN_161630 [Dreissena polymorpha]
MSTAFRRLQPDRRRTRNTPTNHVPGRRVFTVAERTTIRRIAGTHASCHKCNAEGHIKRVFPLTKNVNLLENDDTEDESSDFDGVHLINSVKNCNKGRIILKPEISNVLNSESCSVMLRCDDRRISSRRIPEKLSSRKGL